MDKRVELNLEVRKKITNSLFSILTEKKLQEISISEIVKRASVARASYYRNFESKEDILYDFAYTLHQEYIANINFDFKGALTYDRILYTFNFYYKYKDYISTLYKNGLSHIFLDILNDIVENTAGDMPANSVERYKIYAYTGAIFNMAVKWIESGANETPEKLSEEMSKAFIEFTKL